MTYSYPIAVLLLFCSCDITNSTEEVTEREPINWENGETIESADQKQLTEDELGLYLRDAERLAIDYVESDMPGQADIPAPLVDLLFNGLLHIATSSHEKALEVTEAYNIHTFGLYNYHEIHVFVDTLQASGWIDAWREGNIGTGYSDLDHLTQQFDYTLAEYDERPQHSTSVAILHSDRLLNGNETSRQFMDLEGIHWAGLNATLGDGPDISVELNSDHLLYFFSHGWGDCPAGCIYEHFWDFRVYRNGDVEFLGERGEPLPE